MAQPKHRSYTLAHSAVAALLVGKEPLYAAVQNVAESWNGATSPVANDGLGYSARKAARQVAEFEQFITGLLEPANVYRRWKVLVATNEVIGVQSHDTRLVALMQAHGFRKILTFDSDFTRFPEITVVHPTELVHNRPTS